MTAASSPAAWFQQPGPAQRPALRWWWPGGAVDADALCAQLRGFAEAGWGGVEIQAFRGGLGAVLEAGRVDARRVHQVFTPDWFDTVARVMDQADRLGLSVDLTFGSCWPFGGGEAITPELAAQELSLDWTPVQGPGRWRGRPAQPQRPQRIGTRLEQDGHIDPGQQLPPGWPQRIDAREQTVAVLALRGSAPELAPFDGFVPPLTLADRWGRVRAAGQLDPASCIDLGDRLQADGSLDWEVPPGTWQVIVLRRFVSDQRLAEAAGRGPQLAADPLNRQAFDAHAWRVADAGWPQWQAQAGRAWRSVFVDSLEIPVDLPWCDDFEQQFAQRRGYALRPWLPLLLQPGWRNCFQARSGPPLFDAAEVGPRVRADYRLTVSELMLERLYAPFADWAGRHGVQAKIQAHGAPVDWLQAYGLAGIPETEDLAGGAAPHFLRVARSAAHQQGRARVSAEAFCFLIEGLAVTPQQLRERADAFFAAGVQQLVAHGASAPLAGSDDDSDDAPPWYAFEAMEIGTPLDAHNNPLWPLLRPLTDYLARCQAVLQRGRAVVPVAVLAPLDLFAFLGAAGQEEAPAWHASLQQAGLDWDWISPATLLSARIEQGALVMPGAHRYPALLLPALPALRAELAEHLAAAAGAGLQVWALDRAPDREEGWLDATRRDQRVQQAMQHTLCDGQRVVAAGGIGPALRAAGLAPVLELPAEPGAMLNWHLREDAGQRWLFLHNPQARPQRLALPLQPGQGAELWHGWTGRIERLAADGQGVVPVMLPAGGARLLRLAAADDCRPLPPARPVRAAQSFEQRLAGPWQVQAQGRGLGGRRIAFEQTWTELHDLSRQPALAPWADFAGQLHYRLDFELDGAALQAGPLWLDLGQVADAASVQLNDAPAVTGCEAPFVYDLAVALRPGRNRLHIRVANRPENACRDPQRPGGIPLPGRRLQRLPTGLLGPVRLFTANAPATRWCLPETLP